MTAIVPTPTHAAIVASTRTIDALVALWIESKGARSGSTRTPRIYAAAMASARAALASAGLDLDSDPGAVSVALQLWSHAGRPSAATINHRLSVVSSFYAYAIRAGVLTVNPAARIERSYVDTYAAAVAPESVSVVARMRAIDRASDVGSRDYAILAVSLTTGRRLSEIASLTWRHVTITGSKVTISFDRTKGGKSARDTLSGSVGRALIEWLQRWYGDLTLIAPDAPLWPALRATRTTPGGTAVSDRQIERICAARLNTHFHALRHAFAHAMEDSGATITDIQRRLGHSSVATTGRYLAALRRDENPFASAVADRFGIDM